jgi:hypothetical protein
MAQATKRDDQTYLKEFKDKLSDSTRRAKWIGGADEHQDHPGQTLATRDHDVIKQWAEQRKAVPVTVAGTEHEGRAGVLRFDFPGGDERGGSNRLQEIAWDGWFETFDARDLVFVYQEQLKSGDQSNFFLLDNPHREQG